MFKILSEIHTTTSEITKNGKTVTMHTPDWETSNANEKTMGIRTIPIFNKMSVEDKRAFLQVQGNVEKYKRQLRAQGKTKEADNIPDAITTPPEFIFGMHAYTFKKTPDTKEELKRTLGAMSAIKERNPFYQMDPAHIADFVDQSTARLTANIKRLLSNEHTSILQKSTMSDAMANIAITSSFYWLSKFDKETNTFPAHTVLVPLGSSAGLVGRFAKSLSAKTNTPIIENAFTKSNAPRVSKYTQSVSDHQLRLGTDFVDSIVLSNFGSGNVREAIDALSNYVVNDLGLSDLKQATSKKVDTAIEKLSNAQKQELDTKYVVPEGGKQYSSIDAKIKGYYNFLLKKLRVAITEDYDQINSDIKAALNQLLAVKNDTSLTQQQRDSKRKELISQIKDYRSNLKALPLPNLSTGGDKAHASYDKLRGLLSGVHKHLDTLKISSDDTDTKVQQAIKAIDKSEDLALKLQMLYSLENAKIFKYSGARAIAGMDQNAGFSRFQLANLNVSKQLNGKHVVIVDDNISTGGTVRDAIVSLYANGIVPLSIMVVAPHYLDSAAAKFSPEYSGQTREEWETERKAISAEVTRGDSEARKAAAKKIRDEVVLNDSNPDAIRILAKLAIDIITDNTSFTHIVDAQKIIPNPFMYDQYIDTVVELGKARNQYGNWFQQNIDEIEEAKRVANEQKQKRLEQIAANKVSKAEDEKHVAIRAQQRAAKAEKSRIDVNLPDTTADKITAVEINLEKAKDNPKYAAYIPKFELSLRYLKAKKVQEDNGYVLPNLKSRYQQIIQYINDGKYDLARRTITDLEKEIRQKQQHN